MKIVLLRERKTPPDARVPLTPSQCRDLMARFPDLEIFFEPSPDRCFTDAEYLEAGIQAGTAEIGDILLGVKEVPAEFLIPNKTYLFFSHTIKEQPHNREMFKNVLQKKVRLIDYECLTWPHGGRILGFGHWAGIVGAYNALLVWGKKKNRYQLTPAWQCHDAEELKSELKKLVMGPVKIACTGEGRVAHGVHELLQWAGIREISPERMTEVYDEPVFTRFDYQHLYQHKNGLPFERRHFFQHHADYHCGFSDFTPFTDILINGMYWEKDMEPLFRREEVSNSDFNIQVIADISCDIEGSVPITVMDTKIKNPVFGYHKKTGQICDAYSEGCIDIMAVSNLPAELPRDASDTFGAMLATDVIPLLLHSEPSSIIQDATIANAGIIQNKYAYLKQYGSS